MRMPFVANVRDFGAVGDRLADDSTAFQKAVDSIAVAGKGVLYIPAGDYRLAARISRSMASWAVSVVGEGQGVSNLYCDNPDGIFQLAHEQMSTQITIRDLSLFADRIDAGTAIDISMPEGGNRHNRSLVVQNVEMRGVRQTSDYFNEGIRAVGQWRPLFLNVVFAGPFGPGTNGYEASAPIYRAACGIRVDGSYAPSFQHCYVWSCQTGYSIQSERRPSPEDSAFYRSFAVQCRIGIDVGTNGAEPQLVIDSCHINCRDIGVRLGQRKYFQIVNCLFYNDDYDTAAPAYCDLDLSGCFGGVIAHNIFHQPGNKHREMIRLDDTCYDIAIKDNVFNARGMAVVVPAQARRIVCANNQYTGQETRMIDNSSADLVFGTNGLRRALVRRLNAQSIPDDALTPILWETAEQDTDRFWNGSDAFVIPANKGIQYVRLSANVCWSEHDRGSRSIEFAKNKSRYFTGNGTLRQQAECVEQHVQSSIISVAAGDELSVCVRQTSGDSLALQPNELTWFSVEVVDG